MRYVGLIALSFGGLMLSANAAPAVVRDFPASSFDHVVLDTAASVKVMAGTGYSVHAEGDPSRVTTLTATVKDHTLTLASPDRKSDGRKPLLITVTLPHLAGLDLEGAGRMAADQPVSDDFLAVIGGFGSIDVTAVKAKRTVARIEGNGTIILAGTSETVDVNVSGLGKVDATRLIGGSGTLEVSGKGHIGATVYGSTDARLSGMGSIAVGGHPHCAIAKSGMGSVRCAS